MEKLYQKILEKYNSGDFIEKNRSGKDVTSDMYSCLAKEYMVFMWMKQNKDDRWKDIMKIVLLPNDINVDKLDIGDVMTFIAGSDIDYPQDSIISLFKEHVPKSIEEVKDEAPFFEIEEEEVKEEVKKEEPKKEEVKKEEPKKEKVKKEEVKKEEPKKEKVKKEEVKKEEPKKEEPKKEEPKKEEPKKEEPKKRTKNIKDVEEKIAYSDFHIMIDPYVYNLIKDKDDIKKYIEELILRDLYGNK